MTDREALKKIGRLLSDISMCDMMVAEVKIADLLVGLGILRKVDQSPTDVEDSDLWLEYEMVE
jgi:hypothetical protein